MGQKYMHFAKIRKTLEKEIFCLSAIVYNKSLLQYKTESAVTRIMDLR